MVICFPDPKTLFRQAILSQFTRDTEAQKGEPPKVLKNQIHGRASLGNMLFLDASLRLSEDDRKETHFCTEGWDAGQMEAEARIRQQQALPFSTVSSNLFHRQLSFQFQAPLPPPSLCSLHCRCQAGVGLQKPESMLCNWAALPSWVSCDKHLPFSRSTFQT